MDKIIIFGFTQFSQLIKYYIEQDTSDIVVGFCVNRQYLDKATKESISWGEELPIFAFEDIEFKFPPDEYKVLISVGYKKMNSLRKHVFLVLKDKGYSIASYINSSAIVKNVSLGEGNIILECTIIQPFVSIGVCNIFWSNCTICHHSKIGDFNFYAPSVSSAGNVTIGNNCFMGNNSSINNKIIIADYTFIGAGACVTKDTAQDSIIVPQRSKVLENIKSIDFW